MDDFRELYRQIEYLRNNGIKMKEIADCAGMAPSILSSLYTTVLPTYFEEPESQPFPRTFARRNTAFHHTGGQHMRTLHELQPFFFLGLPEDGTFYHQSIRKQGVHPHRTVKCLRGSTMGHGSHR